MDNSTEYIHPTPAIIALSPEKLYNFYMNTIKNIVIVILFVIAIILLFKSNTENQISDTQQEPASLVSDINCTYVGYGSTGEQFLDTYTVKSGDSLLSISKDIYGDTSKISDLVFLNKHTYNSLSTDSPFIEIGWTLLLPENDIVIDDRGMNVSAGKVFSNDGNQLILKTTSSAPSYNFYKTPTSIPFDSIVPDDCVVIYHGGTDIYKIEKQ